MGLEEIPEVEHLFWGEHCLLKGDLHCQKGEHGWLSASCGDLINSVFSRISHLVPLAFLLLSGAAH